MNILLSGPPFSGKTTIGKELASQLGCPFVNTDTLLEEKYGISCFEQFIKFGNQGFRKNEYLLLSELSQDKLMKVISLGGGTLSYEPNAKIVRELGLVILLQCSFDILYARLLGSGRSPAYLDLNHKKESFRKLLEERQRDYERYCDIIVDVGGMSPKDAAELVVKHHRERIRDFK